MHHQRSYIRAFVRETRQRRVFRTAGIYLVVAWLVLQVSTTVFAVLGLPDRAARLVLGVLAIGFPIATWLAWMFELRGGRIRREAASQDRWTGDRFGQLVVVAVATVIGVGLAALVVIQQDDAGIESAAHAGQPAVGTGLPGTPGTRLHGGLDGVGAERTVALFPFRDLSDDPANTYFAEGFSEQIMIALARFDDMRVLAGGSLARRAVSGDPLDRILREAGAGFALEGTVRRAGDRVRVSSRLTAAGSGHVVWAEAREADLTVVEIFAIQGEVARAVAAALDSRMRPRGGLVPPSSPTESLEAYDHFLRGNHELGRRTPASITQAIAHYRSASALDPAFAEALTREAYANALFVDWGWSPPGGSREALTERGLALADSVLARDSNSAEAWLARAYLLVQKDPYRLNGAIPAFERSIGLDPVNPEAYHQYGQSLMVLGRAGEAATAYHSALALQPGQAMTLVPLAALASRAGDLGEARRWSDSAVAVGPDVPYAWAVRAGDRRRAGDPAGALEDAIAALRIDPSYAVPARSALAAARFALGDSLAAHEEVERAREALRDPSRPGPTDALHLGGALVALGLQDEALDLIQRAYPRSAWLWFYLQSRDFDLIRSDPRFRAVESAADPRDR